MDKGTFEETYNRIVKEIAPKDMSALLQDALKSRMNDDAARINPEELSLLLADYCIKYTNALVKKVILDCMF